MRLIPVVLVLVLAVLLSSQQAPPERVGPLPEGGFRLNSGWVLRPAGRQIPLDTLPMSMLQAGKYVLVLNGGYNPPSISVIDTATEKELGRTRVEDGWLGMALTPKADRLYVGGGSRAAIFEFAFADGKLTPARTFNLLAPKEERTHRDFIGDVQFDPTGRLLYAASLFKDEILVVNPQSGTVIERFKTGRRPYRILFHPDGQSFFVSSWADGSVYHHDTAKGTGLTRVPLAAHPTDMLWLPGRPKVEGEEKEEAAAAPDWVARLYVTAANTNNVYVLGVTESKDIRRLETVNVSMTPYQPAGMTPSALGLSPDAKRLFIACSDANAVAVADVSGVRTQPLGFIPTGWYPTAVRVLGDNRVVILNGKGLRSYPNPDGPNPTERQAPSHLGNRAVQYVARIQHGTLQVVPPFDEAQLGEYSRTVLANSPYRDALLSDAGTQESGGVIPVRVNEPSPIRHVIYVVKENRTYDQMFGDVKPGNGDPALLLFGENATPNHRKLAREFVLLDNFYVNSDVSADGHNWSTAAIAPDYVQKMWPNSYGGRRKHYDYEGGEPAAIPPSGYLWTQAATAGISMRNYGFWCSNLPANKVSPGGPQIENVRDPILAKVTNRRFRGFDLDYLDVDRIKVFLEDLAEFERSGQMPQLILLRIGNDHTSGTSAGKIAPDAAVADNDAALGRLVEAVSKSRFWPQTAIFVLEDDAQNGADHVDSHRSPAFVISPYVKRNRVDSTMYNTTSMLRTMELILGLRPMTHFDAGARPMSGLFQAKPDLTAYTAAAPRIPLDKRNPPDAPAAARSARMDFSEEDRIDDHELNEILWLAMQPGKPAPAPVRSLFAR